MANPNPQHNPTDGLGVAAYIHLSGTSGSSVLTPLRTPGAAGTYSANPGIYFLQLSVGALGGFAATLTPTVAIVDVANNVYTPVASPLWRSYNNPSNFGGNGAVPPAFYKPSNFTDGGALNYVNAESPVQVVNATGAITALKPGQGIIEVSFPTLDNTLGNTDTAFGAAQSQASGTINAVGTPSAHAGGGEFLNQIYMQIIVTCTP